MCSIGNFLKGYAHEFFFLSIPDSLFKFVIGPIDFPQSPYTVSP
jgi:hypothetical protein